MVVFMISAINERLNTMGSILLLSFQNKVSQCKWEFSEKIRAFPS